MASWRRPFSSSSSSSSVMSIGQVTLGFGQGEAAGRQGDAGQRVEAQRALQWLSLMPYCSNSSSISGALWPETLAMMRFWFAVRRKSPSWIFAISRRPVRIG